MMKNDMIQTTAEDLENPIVGATYLWNGLRVAVVAVMPSELSTHTWDVVVEYFSKAGKCYLQQRAQWIPGSFLLTFKPGGTLVRATSGIPVIL
jgi:hypothetical protein